MSRPPYREFEKKYIYNKKARFQAIQCVCRIIFSFLFLQDIFIYFTKQT